MGGVVILKYRNRLIFLLLYGVLLFLSSGMRWWWEEKRWHRADRQYALLEVETEKGKQQLGIAYRILEGRGNLHQAGELPVVVVRGITQNDDAVEKLVKHWQEKRHVLLVDWTGMGGSETAEKDSSIAIQTDYLTGVLEKLPDWEKFHVVGYGYGGTVAGLLTQKSQGVVSLGLISALGVEELTLLGDRTLNQAIYGSAWGILRAGTLVLPHFGWLDQLPFGLDAVNILIDSDQRPVRQAFSEFEEPVLIVHGTEDPLVTIGAAYEHHRIMPQSQLVEIRGGHRIAEEYAEKIGQQFTTFFEQVEHGEGKSGKDVSEEKRNLAQESYSSNRQPVATGHALLVFLILLAVVTHISEDLTCAITGILVSEKVLPYWPAVFALFCGIFIGDLLVFGTGKWLGKDALHKVPFKWFIHTRHIDKTVEFVKRHGAWLIMSSRFLPGTRIPVYFAAGVVGVSFWRFLGIFFLACAIWTPIVVALCALIGGKVLAILRVYEDYAGWAILGTILVAWVVAKVAFPMFNLKGRRMLVATWRGVFNWRSWARWLRFVPVGAVLVKHPVKTLRYFSFLFKEGFRGNGYQRRSTLLKTLGEVVAVEDACVRIDKKQGKWQWEGEWKGNAEQRLIWKIDRLYWPPGSWVSGRGTHETKMAEAIHFAKTERQRIIGQAEIPGRALSLFYIKNQGQGGIQWLGAGERLIPSVIGDGLSSVERLILESPELMGRESEYLRQEGSLLARIPQEGEKVRLLELPCRHAGVLLNTVELEDLPWLEAFSTRLMERKNVLPVVGRMEFRWNMEDEKSEQGGEVLLVEVAPWPTEAIHLLVKDVGLSTAMRQWRTCWEEVVANY